MLPVHRSWTSLFGSLLICAAVGCGSEDVAVQPTADAGVDAADSTLPDTSVDAPVDTPADGSVEPWCATCHVATQSAVKAGKHAAAPCVTCHKDALKHQESPATVPATLDFSIDLCATCHASHKEEYLKEDGKKAGHFGGSAKTSKYLDFPKYTHLMGGHGFTVEYNEERAHGAMLKDHIEIKRKQNAVCLQCKSTSVALFFNETRRGKQVFGKDMAWDEMVKKIRDNWAGTIDYGASCSHCHDPHSGDFRLVRKAMIGSVIERGTDPYGPDMNFVPKNQAELFAKMNERGTDGKRTPAAKRLAGILTCAQCHIEYTCGPGADKDKGIIRDDVPWRKLRDIEPYYKVKYDLQQDWTHSGTKVAGIKAQHPEAEFFWESPHYKRGATCADCHMAKKAGGGTSHWFTSPMKQPADTCGKCHTDADARITTALAVQDSVMAQAKTVEDALDAVLTKIEAAMLDTTFDPVKLATAKDAFMRGLLWWEFTVVSENSAGFHNPPEADTNLKKALDEANRAKVALGM